MRIWIDATQPESRQQIFGLSLVERLLRAFRSADKEQHSVRVIERSVAGSPEAVRQMRELVMSKSRPTEVRIELLPDDPEPDWISEDVLRDFPIHWSRTPGTAGERLRHMLDSAGDDAVLAYSGDAIVDTRLHDKLIWWRRGSAAFVSDEGADSSAIVRLEGPLPKSAADEVSLLGVAQALIKSGYAEQMHSEDDESYIEKLRRSLPMYLYRVSSEATRLRLERFLFDSNYKGSTDFLTKWVYPPIVWRMLHPLAAAHVSPNAVTVVGIVACFGAIPFFAAGMWASGLLLAFLMSVLDSVDGKLARVTFTSSAQGDVLDHGTDVIHPPFWYFAWAWGLSGGDPFSGVFLASLWMSGLYIVDRLLETLFKANTGRSIHGATPFDEKVRTFVSRRNVNLAIFALALPLGYGIESLYCMAVWQGLSALFHLTRVIKFWSTKIGEGAT